MEPFEQTAIEMAREVRQGTVTALELMQSHLQRIESVGEKTNAFVQVDTEAALESAAGLDALASNGKLQGPLHGVPFSVKDWLETNDLVCSAGFEARQDYIAKRDATAVARMRAAGAVLIGKTKAGAVEDLYPLARNPHNNEHTPGASSAGEASAIAAGCSPVGLGSDSGGSLRWPAHYCGIATHKPTSGLIPLTGHFPRIVAMTDPRTVIGPMARSVADLQLTMSLLAGEDGVDSSVVPAAPMDKTSEPLRVAWFTGFPGVSADHATEMMIHRVIEVLNERGAECHETYPDRIDEAFDITRAYWARPESGSLTEWQPPSKSKLSADQVETSLFEWNRLRQSFLRFMSTHDVIVCPVARTAAPKRHTIELEDYLFTAPFSLTGYPVTVIPVGLSDNGLPVGVQIVAKPFRDLLTLRVAQVLEKAVDFNYQQTMSDV